MNIYMFMVYKKSDTGTREREKRVRVTEHAYDCHMQSRKMFLSYKVILDRIFRKYKRGKGRNSYH